MTPSQRELIGLGAIEAVGRLTAGEVTPVEMVEAALARHAEVDGAINAIPTLCRERALEHARHIMEETPADDGGPWLAGLPIAIKDLVDVAGVRTTRGSRIYEHHVPERSDVLVEILESRGAVVIGKSNTPELGAGSHTFNEVFGVTRNPWDTSRSAGGSSGGAAAALAAGEVWLANGSDFGGSLRNPASFCSVVGLRPSPGRVARGPRTHTFGMFSVEGPMARTVADVALMFDVQVGHHPADPVSMAAPETPFRHALEGAGPPLRVGFSRDLGIGPVAREVADVCAAAAARIEGTGTVVEEACPDLSDAIEMFHVLRAAQFVTNYGPLVAAHRDLLKPEIVWNVEEGLALGAEDVGRAERARAALYERVRLWFEDYDLLLCPAAIVPPFPAEERYVEEVGGHRFDNYLDWMATCFAITLTACPAISIPAGFTAGGLPVGLQVVGRPRGEAALLAASHLFEQALGVADQTPIDPRVAVST